MKRLKQSVAGAVFVLALLVLIGGSFIAFVPSPAQADMFSAGNWDQGGSICSCPVTVGDCVCRFKE